MHAIVLDCLPCRREDCRMTRQAQVILRSEVHALHEVALIVARRTDGHRAAFGRTGKGPQPAPSAQILPIEEVVDALGGDSVPSGPDSPSCCPKCGRRRVVVRGLQHVRSWRLDC